MLRALREDVIFISKARGFRRSDPDTVWMPRSPLKVGSPSRSTYRFSGSPSSDWCAPSQDCVWFLAEGFRNKPFFEQAKFLVNHWDTEEATDRAKPGECFRVTVRGRVEPMTFKGK
jgi:hypothetical protein